MKGLKVSNCGRVKTENGDGPGVSVKRKEGSNLTRYGPGEGKESEKGCLLKTFRPDVEAHEM